MSVGFIPLFLPCFRAVVQLFLFDYSDLFLIVFYFFFSCSSFFIFVFIFHFFCSHCHFLLQSVATIDNVVRRRHHHAKVFLFRNRNCSSIIDVRSNWFRFFLLRFVVNPQYASTGVNSRRCCPEFCGHDMHRSSLSSRIYRVTDKARITIHSAPVCVVLHSASLYSFSVVCWQRLRNSDVTSIL